MASLAVLGIGGNIANPLKNMELALEKIGQKIGSIDRSSGVYKTSPWGVENQPEYLNAVVGVYTNLSPHEVLSNCLSIEKELGRSREGVEKWSERLIDIDVLYIDDLKIDSKELKVPHPFIQDRKFVLVPLAEIYPNYCHPILENTTLELLQECSDKGKVEKM